MEGPATMDRYLSRLSTLLTTVLLALMAVTPPAVAGNIQSGTPALFDGEIIDISADWGGATACLVAPDLVDIPECFRTEAEMNERIGQLGMGAGGPLTNATVASTTCSGFLRLYDGTSYSGTSLALNVRGKWINLTSYGFDQRTSSFKIGACSAYFADLVDGGGSWYPTGDTQAYDQSPSMISGWNNDLSSLYIN